MVLLKYFINVIQENSASFSGQNIFFSNFNPLPKANHLFKRTFSTPVAFMIAQVSFTRIRERAQRHEKAPDGKSRSDAFAQHGRVYSTFLSAFALLTCLKNMYTIRKRLDVHAVNGAKHSAK